MRLIRWSGLLAWVLILAVILGIGLLLLPYAIKRGIEGVGTQLNGAAVEVDRVALSWRPVGISIHRMQVTNPHQPLRNRIEFDRIDLAADLHQALQSKLHIHTLDLGLARWDTPREHSGALVQAQTTAQPSTDAPSPDKTLAAQSALHRLAALRDKLPSVDELLARAQLGSTAQIPKLTDLAQQQWQQLQTLPQTWPSTQRITEYQQRIEHLRQTQVDSLPQAQALLQQLNSLKQDYQQDKNALHQSVQQIDEAQRTLSAQVNQVHKQAQQDIQRLQNQYQFDTSGLGNIAELLLGEALGGLIKQAIAGYQTLSPWLTRLHYSQAADQVDPQSQAPQGRWIEFPIHHPSADVWIKRANMALAKHPDEPILQEHYQLTVTDISGQQALTGNPLVATLQMDSANEQSDRIQLILDRRQTQAHDHATVSISGRMLQDVIVHPNPLLHLQQAQLTIDGELDSQPPKLSGQIQWTLNDLSWHSSSIAQLDTALTTLDSIDARLKISGTVDQPQLSLRSSLTDALSAALMASLTQQAKQLQAQLAEQLQQRVQQQLGGVTGSLQQLDQLNLNAQDRQQQLTQQVGDRIDQAQAQLTEQVEQYKRAATDKLKGQAKEKLDNLIDKNPLKLF